MSDSGSAESPSRNRPHWLVVGLAAIGLCALVGFVLLLFGLGVFGGDFGGRREPAKVADVAGRATFVVGQVSELDGTDLVRIDIMADRSDRISASSYGSGSGTPDRLRNILLLDKGEGTTRPILPNNERLIVSSRFLPAQADRAGTSDDGMVREIEGARDVSPALPPAYYLLTIRSADARTGSGDAEPSNEIDLLVGTLATGRQGIVMRGIDAVESSWMQSATQLGLVVRDDLALHYRVIDIPTLRVVTSRRIEIG